MRNRAPCFDILLECLAIFEVLQDKCVLFRAVTAEGLERFALVLSRLLSSFPERSEPIPPSVVLPPVRQSSPSGDDLSHRIARPATVKARRCVGARGVVRAHVGRRPEEPRSPCEAQQGPPGVPMCQVEEGASDAMGKRYSKTNSKNVAEACHNSKHLRLCFLASTRGAWMIAHPENEPIRSTRQHAARTGAARLRPVG